MVAWVVIGLIVLVWLVASMVDSRIPGHRVFWPWNR